MATIGSGSPLLYVEGSAVQTGGSGNSRTIKITAKFKVNGSSNWYYGYACNWRARVNNSYGSWTQIKGTESWNGGQALRTFEQTLTVDVGTTSSKAITVGIYTDSQIDNGWDGSYTWSFTVGATNVAPSLSGTITADGTTSNKTIPENQGSIALSAPAASDSNLSGYRFAVSVNGGGYTEIYKGSSRTYTHNISGGEGTTYKYSCYAYDSAGLNSSTIYSPTITKNTLTADTLASTSSVNYSSSSIGFTYSGAKNTNGNTTFTRSLSCDGLTVYNPSLGASPATVTIYKSGTVPTTCYVKFDDIKSKLASSSYKGSLIFSLSTTNTYGTKKSTSKTISVDLQVAPNASGAPTMATDANSTSYVTSVGSTKYYIPASGRKTRVNWTAGSGKLGEAVSYDVYVSYNSGAWQYLANTSNNYYDHVFTGAFSAKQSVKYMVRTKVSYGLYADTTQTTAVDYHYWNPPSIVVNTPVRAATTATTTIALKLNTSIPSGVSPSGTWQSFVSGSATVHQSGTLTSSTANQNISMSGLAENSGYTLKITYKDNTAFSANIIQEVSIPANQPVFFVNKYGAGVGGAKANANSPLVLKGGVDFDLNIANNASVSQTPVGVSAFNANAVNQYTTTLSVKKNDSRAFQLLGTHASEQLYFRAGHNSGTTGEGEGWFPWRKVYTEVNKPTPNEINAIGQKSLNGYQGMSVNNNDDQTWVRTTKNGLIPYQSAGDSSLGTSGWPFSNVYANNIYMGGSKVVERGGNGNGEYTKFADGTLICVKVLNVTTTITSTWGNIYTSGLPINMGPPAHSFVAADYKMSITMGSYNSGGEQYTAGILVSKGNGYRPPGTSDFGQAIELFRGTSMPSKNYNIQIIAIGRWK